MSHIFGAGIVVALAAPYVPFSLQNAYVLDCFVILRVADFSVFTTFYSLFYLQEFPNFQIKLSSFFIAFSHFTSSRSAPVGPWVSEQPDTMTFLPDKLVLLPAPFSVPDDLEPLSELISFVSYAAAWASSLTNKIDAGDITDTEETNLSWLSDTFSYGTDYSVVGGAADSLEVSKDSGSSVSMYLDIFWDFRPPPFFFPSGNLIVSYSL